MGVSVTSAIEVEARIYAAPAAERVEAFWPDITVRLSHGMVTLASERRSANELTLTWMCALLNEQLVVTSATDRASVLANLIA